MRLLLMLPLIMLCLSNQSCSTSLNPVLVHRILPYKAPLRVTGLRHSRQLQRVVAVKAAQRLLHGELQTAGLTFEPDPIGFVRAAWWEAGLDLFSEQDFQDPDIHGMAILYRSVSSRQSLFKNQPKPGDLIFLGDPQTEKNPFPAQVALVESIDANGSVYALGRFADGPGRIRLDLKNEGNNSEAIGTVFKDTSPGKTSISLLFWGYALPY